MKNAGGFSRLVAGVACLAVAYAPLAPVVWGAPGAPDAATTLTNSLRALQDGENAAPRDHWDPKYVEAQLGRNPGRTFAWVRDHTYWIPYHGILRGPVGVLMDRQGDSLDRALLLATMLEDEGQTVRLAHGTMASDRANRMMSPLLIARIVRQLRPASSSDPSNAVSSVATKYGLDPTAVRKTIDAQQAARAAQQARFKTLSGQMRRLIAAAGEAPADDDARNVNHALTALADHWWVETQTGGVWRASDLLAGDPSKPLATADRTIDPSAIPVGLYHQVTIRVVIERWAAGITSEKTALQQTFQPAQTIGVPITLSITAGDPLKAFPAAGQDAAATFRAHAIGQHEWTPSLDIGKQHVVQNAITDSGNVTVPSNDTDVLAVAKGVTHGLAGAIDDAFGSGPPASASPAPAAGAASILSAAWIEYRIAAPGEPVQTVRRQIFDLPGPAARAAKSTTWRIDDAGKLSRSLSLTMTTDILPVNCALAPQFVEHLSRQTLLANASVAQDIVSGRIADDFAGVQSASGRMVKTGTSLYDLATRRLNSSPVAPFVYVDRPDILTRHLFFTGNGTALTPTGATDIVANGVGVDPTGPSRFTMAIAQGVYDTSGEAALYSSEPNPGNAAWAFGAGGDWITIAKPGAPALATLQVGADVRERVDAALASNHIVIVPRSRVPVGGGTFAGWWQVDKSTGETLGMGETGWGQELAEYTVVMAAGWGFVTGWLFCKLSPRASGGAPIVAANAAHPPRTLFDVFETRVEASSDSCIGQAFLSAGTGLVGAGFGTGTGGGSSDPGEVGRSLPEDPVDPFAKTQPVPAVGSGGSGGADGTGGAAGSGGSAGAGNGAGGGSGEPPSANPSPPGGGGSNPDPDAAARFQDAKRRYEQLFDSPDVLGRQQALKEMIRNQPRGIPDDLRNALDEDIRQLAEQRAARGLGTAGGGTSGADQLPPTLRSAGVGSGGAGQGSGGAGGGSGTAPGLGPCAPNCGPSGTTTLVGLGGAMNALGGS